MPKPFPRTGNLPIAADEKSYSDEEFALILRRASELARAPGTAATPTTTPRGLSLAEMMEIAAEAGLDPALVARAARLLPDADTPTTLGRIAGAPIKIRMGAEFATPLTLDRAEALLALLRASAERQGEGEATGSGVTWHSVGEGTQYLVSIHADDDRTHLRVVADRSGALAITGVLGLAGSLAAGVVVLAIGEVSGIQAHPLVGLGLMAGAAGGALAASRAVWRATSNQVRRRVAALTETLGRSLQKLEDERDVDDGPS